MLSSAKFVPKDSKGLMVQAAAWDGIKYTTYAYEQKIASGTLPIYWN